MPCVFIFGFTTLQYLAFLESTPGRQAIIDLHVKGIISYVSI